MPKVLAKPVTRVCTRLFTEDLKLLDELAAASGEKRDVLLRNVVHWYCTQAGDKLRQRIDAMET